MHAANNRRERHPHQLLARSPFLQVFVVFDGRAKANKDIFTQGPSYENTYFTPADMQAMIVREQEDEADVSPEPVPLMVYHDMGR